VWAGLLIFLFSVVLEIVQFYLPYRTFNVYDVVANGVGILSFFIIWMIAFGKDDFFQEG
jgi:VanZ family protein